MTKERKKQEKKWIKIIRDIVNQTLICNYEIKELHFHENYETEKKISFNIFDAMEMEEEDFIIDIFDEKTVKIVFIIQAETVKKDKYDCWQIEIIPNKFSSVLEIQNEIKSQILKNKPFPRSY